MGKRAMHMKVRQKYDICLIDLQIYFYCTKTVKNELEGPGKLLMGIIHLFVISNKCKRDAQRDHWAAINARFV